MIGRFIPNAATSCLERKFGSYDYRKLAERGVDKYLIKTEKANLVSNRFYKKIGAELVAKLRKNSHHLSKKLPIVKNCLRILLLP